MAEGVIEITDKTFANVISDTKPVLVDFWAPWCGPCRAVAPIVEELAADNKDKLIVGKINVDDNQQTAAQYGVTSIPTLIIFKGGEAVERVIGAQSKNALQKAIDSAL